METHDDENGGAFADNSGNVATLMTPEEARDILIYALAAHGQRAIDRWVTGRWSDHGKAVARVQNGEDPTIVARDFIR